ADKLKKQNDTLRATSEAHRKDSERLVQAQADLTARLINESVRWAPEVKGLPDASQIGSALINSLKNRQEGLDRLRTTISTMRDEKKKADDLIARLRATEEAYKSLVNTRQNDAGVQRQQIKDEQDKNFKLVQEMNELRDTAVNATIQSRTLKERNTQLED